MIILLHLVMHEGWIEFATVRITFPACQYILYCLCWCTLYMYLKGHHPWNTLFFFFFIANARFFGIALLISFSQNTLCVQAAWRHNVPCGSVQWNCRKFVCRHMVLSTAAYFNVFMGEYLCNRMSDGTWWHFFFCWIHMVSHRKNLCIWVHIQAYKCGLGAIHFYQHWLQRLDGAVIQLCVWGISVTFDKGYNKHLGSSNHTCHRSHSSVLFVRTLLELLVWEMYCIKKGSRLVLASLKVIPLEQVQIVVPHGLPSSTTSIVFSHLL